jgi:hypothetical protein
MLIAVIVHERVSLTEKVTYFNQAEGVGLKEPFETKRIK